MISHLDTLVRIIVSSESINLPPDASLGLLKGAVVILCNLSNMNEISEQLFKLCTIQVEGLQKVINGELKEGTKALPIYWLDRLTSIFRYEFIFIGKLFKDKEMLKLKDDKAEPERELGESVPTGCRICKILINWVLRGGFIELFCG